MTWWPDGRHLAVVVGRRPMMSAAFALPMDWGAALILMLAFTFSNWVPIARDVRRGGCGHSGGPGAFRHSARGHWRGYGVEWRVGERPVMLGAGRRGGGCGGCAERLAPRVLARLVWMGCAD